MMGFLSLLFVWKGNVYSYFLNSLEAMDENKCSNLKVIESTFMVLQNQISMYAHTLILVLLYTISRSKLPGLSLKKLSVSYTLITEYYTWNYYALLLLI